MAFGQMFEGKRRWVAVGVLVSVGNNPKSWVDSVEKVGDNSEILVNALDEHRNKRLQFAGEHCIEVGNGCVHGAFETGEIAARNLLGVFGKEWDGQDTTARSVSP